MQVWTVANQKGGVGKTTTSIALGGLAAERGSRVLLLDLDPHGSMSCYFRHNPDTMALSCFNLFQERKQLNPGSVSRLVIETSYKNLSLMPASTALATLERQTIGHDGMGLVISKALSQIYDDFDLVIIDTPPLLGVLMINALAACSRLIIPVQTEFLALKGLERMVHTLAMMRRSRKGNFHYTIIPTLFDRRTQASIASLRTIRNTYSENVWPGRVPVDTKFRDASKAGIPPHLYEPESRGVKTYRSLLKWLLGEAQPVSHTAIAGDRT